jgi:hypothetical protein
LSLTADTKNKRSFFVSTIVISRYKKLTTVIIINHFSSSEVHINRARRRGGMRHQGHRAVREGWRGAAAGGPGRARAGVHRCGIPRRTPTRVRLN